MNHFLITTGVTPVGSVWANLGTLAGEDFPEEILRQARDLGKKLVRSWKEKAAVPEAEEVRKSFKERMRRLMLYRKEDWPYEYEFWKKHRGLKQDRPRRLIPEPRRTLAVQVLLDSGSRFSPGQVASR